MRFKLMTLPMITALLLAGTPIFAADNAPAEAGDHKLTAAEVAKQRKAILDMRDATLKRLYKAKPATQNEIAKAEGYAVFDSNQANWGGMAYLPNSDLNDTQDTKGTKDTIKPNEAGK